MPTLRRQLHLFVAALTLGSLLAGAAPVAGAKFESLAPLKRLQAERMLQEPMERREERREAVERRRELRRLAKKMKRSGQTSLRTGGERARPNERVEPLPPLPAGLDVLAPRRAGGEAAPANRRCNNTAGDGSRDCQSETSIVAWNNFMVAAWNDGSGASSGSNQFQGYATSIDGGLTWVDRGAPPVPAGRPNWEWTSDPVLAVNSRTGAFYFSALVDPDGASGSTSGISVVKGRFVSGSLVWETPSLVRSVDTSTDFLDKQWIAVDPNNGRVYISYTRFFSGLDQIEFQAADSALTAWSSVTRISVQSTGPADERGLVQGSRPVVGSDGSVYVMYYLIGETNVDYYRLARSTNLGATFSSPTTITPFVTNYFTGGPGFNRDQGMFNVPFASLSADRSGGEFDGRLYLSWSESLDWTDDLATLGQTGNTSEIEPNNTFTAATAFTSGQMLRGVLSSGASDPDWFKVALGAGQHVVFMADSLPVTVAINMRLIGPDGSSQLMFTRAFSSDIGGGIGPCYSFTAPTAATYHFQVTAIAGSGSYRIRTGAAVRGSERGRDQRDVFVSHSDDHGATWSTPERANDSPVGYDEWLPEVTATADGHVYSSWLDFRDSPPLTGGAVSRIYVSRSDDGGTVWNANDLTSDAGSAWTSVATNLQPNCGDYNSLFGYDRGVAACWGDGRGGTPDAYMAQWDAAMRADVTTALATSDSTVLVNWQLTPNTTVTPTVYRRSLPGGAWTLMQVLPPASGATSFTDTAVVPNARYEYRLGIVVDGRERYYGNAQVTMPSGPLLALALTGVYPNPVDRAASSSARVAFVLPGTAPAQLQLLDISGRLVATYELGSPGPGPHQFVLPAGGDIRPGIYLLRLVQGSLDTSRRISILR